MIEFKILLEVNQYIKLLLLLLYTPSDFVAGGERKRILIVGKNYLSKYSLPDYDFFPS